jgi:hypothetical protein
MLMDRFVVPAASGMANSWDDPGGLLPVSVNDWADRWAVDRIKLLNVSRTRTAADRLNVFMYRSVQEKTR